MTQFLRNCHAFEIDEAIRADRLERAARMEQQHEASQPVQPFPDTAKDKAEARNARLVIVAIWIASVSVAIAVGGALLASPAKLRADLAMYQTLQEMER
ncbi:hypothetical protein [Paenirhodobacter populi]|uniref:Uncharacterized protein n=1 Tax=Paenirhodobacter populi TaxID=2306993 RepID=A0A443J7A0_9RHOB|nr:hypothetical protein [Sinirhodobacter populi]RWR16404.1 hypothetical protein D2T30_21675 [Sinirhodobacter populi]